jgi:CubicO group peptidase (beta-lactamase class C family)
MATMTILHGGTAEEAGFLPDRIDLIRERAASWVENGNTPSLVVLAARRGVVCLHEAYGCLTPEADSPPLTVDTIFPIMSASKPVVAAAIMLLVEEGRLSLNRPVVEYIPELCGEGTDEILVHQLLTHTAGFSELAVMMFAAERLSKPINLPPMDETQHKPIHLYLHGRYPCAVSHKPGSQNMYGTYTYDLLAEIVRKVSGQRVEDFIGGRIFEPLGMNDSSYRMQPEFEGCVVRRPVDGPLGNDQEVFNLNHPTVLDMPWGGGGMLGTARDLAVFGQTFLNGGEYGGRRLVSPASAQAMTTNQIPGIGVQMMGHSIPEGSWGYGFMVQGNDRWPWDHGALQPIGSFYHQGMGGVSFWCDPLNEIVGVFLSVWSHFDMAKMEAHWDFDLFQNMVTASVAH